ncbi:MazG-like pyrophosphatase [Vibrio phage vB_VpaS_MAR10]|uniref:Putative MazG pyrophosphatase n=1 Tax=Vibrio phage vB_VpaS_MAR10 TaxID=1229755 RepID=K7RVS5_9CAUD|nr:MazG-like pyrophosphatase [Vibrio phage vB_VpaS_MAR10]AFV81315.1 putative MazG pyrophosphatase [Vibrio phage vB_VpaS_MAR10]
MTQAAKKVLSLSQIVGKFAGCVIELNRNQFPAQLEGVVQDLTNHFKFFSQNLGGVDMVDYSRSEFYDLLEEYLNQDTRCWEWNKPDGDGHFIDLTALVQNVTYELYGPTSTVHEVPPKNDYSRLDSFDSKKTVKAAVIAAFSVERREVEVCIEGDDTNPIEVIKVTDDFFARSLPVAGQSVLVIYENGYQSHSPLDVFTKGYDRAFAINDPATTMPTHAYVESCLGTLSQDYFEPDATIINCMKEFIISGNVLDGYKKSTFYGRERPVVDLAEKLEIADIADWRRLERKEQALFHAVIGMATESTELVEQMFAYMFQGKELDTTNLYEEVGDNLFYVSVLLKYLGVSYEQTMYDNHGKRMKRFKGGLYSSEAAINRDVEAELQELTNSGNLSGQ